MNTLDAATVFQLSSHAKQSCFQNATRIIQNELLEIVDLRGGPFCMRRSTHILPSI